MSSALIDPIAEWDEKQEEAREKAVSIATWRRKWFDEAVDVVRKGVDGVLNSWFEFSPSDRTGIENTSKRLHGISTQAQEFIDSTRALLSAETVNAYVTSLAAYKQAVDELRNVISVRMHEQERKSVAVSRFALAQPGFREGVERSRRQLAEGKYQSPSVDELRERAIRAKR